jgi:hypothetical protein
MPLTNFWNGIWKRAHMNEFHQLATAMLAIAFAAVMLVAGQLYIENKSARLSAAPTVAMAASVPWDKPSANLSW